MAGGGAGEGVRDGEFADEAVHSQRAEAAAELDHLAEAAEVGAQVVDVAPEPLVDDELDDARDALVGRERGGADVFVEQLDGEAFVVHGASRVNVARLAEEAGRCVNGHVY